MSIYIPCTGAVHVRVHRPPFFSLQQQQQPSSSKHGPPRSGTTNEITRRHSRSFPGHVLIPQHTCTRLVQHRKDRAVISLSLSLNRTAEQGLPQQETARLVDSLPTLTGGPADKICVPPREPGREHGCVRPTAAGLFGHGGCLPHKQARPNTQDDWWHSNCRCERAGEGGCPAGDGGLQYRGGSRRCGLAGFRVVLSEEERWNATHLNSEQKNALIFYYYYTYVWYDVYTAVLICTSYNLGTSIGTPHKIWDKEWVLWYSSLLLLSICAAASDSSSVNLLLRPWYCCLSVNIENHTLYYSSSYSSRTILSASCPPRTTRVAKSTSKQTIHIILEPSIREQSAVLRNKALSCRDKKDKAENFQF